MTITSTRPTNRILDRPVDRAAPFDLAGPEGPDAGRRWPELTVGLFLIAVFALAAVWLYRGATSATPVVVARSAIAEGDRISAGDLRVVDIATDETIASLAPDAAAALIGHAAATDIAAGTVLTVDHVRPDAGIAAGAGIIGINLGPGDYPTVTLRPGDTVAVIITGHGADGDGAAIEVPQADVVASVELNSQGQRLISLTVDLVDAAVIADAAADGRVALVHVNGDVG